MFHEGDVLRKWREQRKWTVIALAKKANVDKNTISRAERGDAMRTDKLRAIVLALGHTLEELHRALKPSAELLPGEREHLAQWRRLSDEARHRIGAMTRLVADLETHSSKETE